MGYHLIERYMGQHVTAAKLHVMTWTGPPDASEVDPLDDALRCGRPLNDRLGAEHGDEAARRVTEEYKVIVSKALENTRDPVRLRAEKERSAAFRRIAFAKCKLNLIGFLIAVIVVYFVCFFLASFIGRASLRGKRAGADAAGAGDPSQQQAGNGLSVWWAKARILRGRRGPLSASGNLVDRVLPVRR